MAPVPDLLNVATTTKAIITIPITLYMDMGMVMIGEKGVPRDGAMGGSIESTSATKRDANAKSAPSTLLQIHPMLVP